MDHLEDIQSFLTTNSFSNVFIDGFVVFPGESLNNYNQINIQSEPVTSSKLGQANIIFGIYVKNKDKETAKNTSKSIRQLLLKSGGKIVNTSTIIFKRFFVDAEPYFWGVSENGENIYLTRYSAITNNLDINTIFNRI